MIDFVTGSGRPLMIKKNSHSLQCQIASVSFVTNCVHPQQALVKLHDGYPDSYACLLTTFLLSCFNFLCAESETSLYLHGMMLLTVNYPKPARS